MGANRTPVGNAFYLAAMIVFALWLALVLWNGGFVIWWFGVRISSRDPLRPALALGVLIAFYVWKRRLAYQADSEALVTLLHEKARWVAAVMAVIVYLMAATLGTWSASGADASGYVSQSARWLDGTIVQPEPLLTAWKWPNDGRSLAPLGYTVHPSGTSIVPVYAPGLPLIMAFSRLFAGECGPFLIIPIFAALAIIATYLLGEVVSSPIVGLIAAIWLACSPTFLYLSMVPMSDVPVAAAWTLSLVLVLRSGASSRLVAGIAAGIAILIRPNLAPVLPLLAFGLLVLERSQSSWKQSVRDTAIFTLSALPGIVVAAVTQHMFYGAPWRSGYGALGDLFSVENVLPNALRYSSNLVQTQSPLILLALATLAGAGVAASRLRHRSARICVGLFIAAVWACYLPYFQFGEWWYLRFLLSTFPILIVLALVPVWHVVRRYPAPIALPLTLSMVFGLITYEATAAGRRMDLSADGEQRYPSVGRYIRESLPPNAAIISMQHSGSVRYYANRLTVRYDFLDGRDLSRAIAVLKERGYRPFVLLEDWEEPAFRRRFRADPLGSLEYRLLATYPDFGVTRLYDPELPVAPTWDSIPYWKPPRCGLLGISLRPPVKRGSDPGSPK